jgi:hypothetical protein
MFFVPWIHREPGKFEQTLRGGENVDYRTRWTLHDKYETEDHTFPHMIGVVHNGLVQGEPLVRSDLLCAMGIIIDRMGLEWSQGHLIFPVRPPFRSSTFLL